MEQEDYSKIYEYESMGKEYAGEKACISLTSWKARINTVSKTLYSLVKMCPGFHIVLVLSKDEFPLKEKELPDNLMLFVENKLIELFWIKPNLKSFKKVLFTMDKYRDVPVISADDDCIYTCNYAQELYDKWDKNTNSIHTFNGLKADKFHFCRGPSTLYPPNIFNNLIDIFKIKIPNIFNDDALLAAFTFLHNIPIYDISKKVYLFHDEKQPLSKLRNYTIKDTLFFIKILKCL